jgi:hypothetical protein
MTEMMRSKFLGYPELLFYSKLPWLLSRSQVSPNELSRNCQYHQAFGYLAPDWSRRGGSRERWRLSWVGWLVGSIPFTPSLFFAPLVSEWGLSQLEICFPNYTFWLAYFSGYTAYKILGISGSAWFSANHWVESVQSSSGRDSP